MMLSIIDTDLKMQLAIGIVQYLEAFSSAREPCALEQDGDGAPPPKPCRAAAGPLLPPEPLYLTSVSSHVIWVLAQAWRRG